MSLPDPIRVCACGTRLAADNPDATCSACVASRRDGPGPLLEVPPTFWDDPALLDALASRHMGQVIRAWRTHPFHGRRPISQETLGHGVGITQPQISRIENGPPILHLDQLAYWANLLSLPPSLLWFALPDHPLHQVSDRPRQSTCDCADRPGAGFGEPAGIGEHGAMDRRALLAGLGSLVASAAFQRPRPVAPELVDYFESQIRSHYQADMLAGPLVVIETVTAQYQAICRAVDATSGPLRSRFLRVAISYAALAGWLHQDLGDHPTSAAWRTETLELAHRCGDPNLISYALTNKAMLHIDLGHGPTATDFATAALTNPSQLAPKVQILALVQQAHGHSLTGNRSQVDRSLDTIADLADRVDDNWPWGNAFRRTPDYLNAQRATCYTRLGLAAQANDLWSSVISDQPATHRRDAGVYQARHAHTLLDAGHPDQATHQAGHAVACYHETGSARLRHELTTLRRKATSSPSPPARTELVDLLHDVA